MIVKAETLLKIVHSLEKKYGIPQKPVVKIPIIDQIIIHFLSDQEKQENVEKSYHSILKEFVDWNEIRVSHPREIQQVLENSLKFETSEKSHKIKDALQQIFTLYNKLELEVLWEKDFSEIQKLAQQVPGLGQEFLLKFICYLYFQEESSLASSFFRIGKRLNLWDENSNPSLLKKNFIKEIGAEKFAHLKILLFIHGETQCLAKNYDCGECPLFKICKRAQKESQEELICPEKNKELKSIKENKEARKLSRQSKQKSILTAENLSISKEEVDTVPKKLKKYKKTLIAKNYRT